MNKHFLLGGVTIALALSAISCTKDGYSEMNITRPAAAISLITSLSDGSVVASEGNYAFNIKMTNTETSGTISSPDLIANNTSLNFNTDSQGYKSSGYDYFFENVKGTVGNSTMELNNANFLALYLYDMEFENENSRNKYGYFYDETKIGEYTYQVNVNYPWITVAKYNIGSSYRVNTFQKNTFFRGTTRTTYPANPQGFVTDDIIYRFILKKAEKSDAYTADMILYNARFAQEMPVSLIAVLVEDLNVDFTPDGIKITGKDIIPKWYTNNEYLPLERYIFRSVDFTTTDEYYASGRLIYHVGDDYEGYFEGSYLKSNFLGVN